MTNHISDRLKTLGIDLPPAGPPAAAYVMAATSGNTVFLSGHIAKKEGIYAIGYNAKDVGARQGLKTQMREKLARVKVFVDALFGAEPKFLGEPVLIPKV